jgi:HPt (histidine-containing phosphotransfer) domain-containing protein
VNPDDHNPSGPPRLDAVSLARLRELDPDGRHGVVMRVLSAFEASLLRMTAQLQADGADQNPGVVATVAHTLKSSAASVGALELSRTCSEVERRLREGQPGNLDADIARLLAATEAALVAVRAMLQP